MQQIVLYIGSKEHKKSNIKSQSVYVQVQISLNWVIVKQGLKNKR